MIDNFEGEFVDPEKLSEIELRRIRDEIIDSLDRHYYYHYDKARMEADLAEIDDELAWRTYSDDEETVS